MGSSEEWKEYRLGDITTILGDGLHGTPQYDENGTVYFINGNNLENGRIVIKESTKKVSIDEAQRYSKPLNDRTILVSINGTIGNVALYKNENCILGKSACFFNIKDSFDKRFVYYIVSSNDFKNTITGLATGTTIKNVSLKTMREYSFKAPSLPTQQKIASILSSLDNKIELNRRINENLEQQAQALFKSWFIDFEPFKDGKFVESELGMIPEGWKVGKLANICKTITKGTTPTTLKKSFVEKGVNFIKAESILDDHSIDEKKLAHIDDETNHLLSRSIIHEGDIIFTIAGTLGRFALIDKTILPANTNQAVAIIRSKESISYNYLYSFFLGGWHNEYYNKHIQQAVQANLSLGTIKSLDIILLPDSLMKIYLSLINPIFDLIKSNQQENQRLATLRDTLLPKLMSGEIDVNAIPQ